VLGGDSHLTTQQKGSSYIFTFYDPEHKCRDLQTAFFSEESTIAGNSRALLDCTRDVSWTVGQARTLDKWEKPE
jgi:hypothetical protein